MSALTISIWFGTKDISAKIFEVENFNLYSGTHLINNLIHNLASVHNPEMYNLASDLSKKFDYGSDIHDLIHVQVLDGNCSGFEYTSNYEGLFLLSKKVIFKSLLELFNS